MSFSFIIRFVFSVWCCLPLSPFKSWFKRWDHELRIYMIPSCFSVATGWSSWYLVKEERRRSMFTKSPFSLKPYILCLVVIEQWRVFNLSSSGEGGIKLSAGRNQSCLELCLRLTHPPPAATLWSHPTSLISSQALVISGIYTLLWDWPILSVRLQ